MVTELKRMQQRTDTGANWDAEDPVLLPAEIGYDETTGRFKIGDGTSLWSELDYAVFDTLILAAAQALLDQQESLAGIDTTDTAVDYLLNHVSSTRTTLGLSYARGVSVTDRQFGATGDGATDDSAAIRAAETAAAAFGADLYFPEGTYIVSRVDLATAYALRIGAGRRWYGSGTIKLAASAPDYTRVIRVDGDGATIEGLTIDGNMANQVWVANDRLAGIFIDNSPNTHLHNLTIINCGGDGITVNENSDGTSIRFVTIRNTSRSGIALVGPSDDVLIGFCHISETQATPIDGEQNNFHGDRVRIIGNFLSAATTADLALTTAGDDALTNINVDWTVMGNVLRGGTYLYNQRGIRFIGNQVEASGSVLQAAVSMSMSYDSLVQGNNIKMTGTAYGLLCQVANNVTPRDQQILDNRIQSTSTGIMIRGGRNIVVSRNICSANGVATASGITLWATDPTLPMQGITVTHNTVRNYLLYAVQLTMSGTNTMSGVIIRENICVDDQGVATMTTALRISGTASQYTNIFFGGDVLLGGVTVFVSDNTTGGPISPGITRNGRRRETWGTAAPTTGTWSLSDLVWNQAPGLGGPLCWLCVGAGTPGTWVAVYGRNQTATTTQLADITNAINTTDKFIGKQVFNTTTGKPVYAVLATAAGVWNDATGTLAHTPV